MVTGSGGGASRNQVEQVVEQKIAPLKKDIEEIKKMLTELSTSIKTEHGTLDQKADATLEDTDSIRRAVEPTDEGF